MNRIFSLALALVLVANDQSSALAFNELGHSVIAKIAYDNLSDPQRDAIHDVLKVHPHYGEYLAASRPQGVSEREWAIIRASTWSDWVRSHHRDEFHEGDWHYINYPYRAHQADITTLPAPLAQEKNILERIPLVVEAAKGDPANDLELPSTLTPEQRRAVALCWLLHLYGDVHQALHVAALVEDTRLPRGDQGGNLLTVVVKDTKPMKLHSFWDGGVGTDARYSNISKVAQRLRDDPLLVPSNLAQLTNHTTVE